VIDGMFAKVYIASPHKNGNAKKNIERAIIIGENLSLLGFIPYIPHQEHDLEQIAKCDFLLRVSGESKSADAEVKYAKEHNIPVATSLDHLKRIACKVHN